MLEMTKEIRDRWENNKEEVWENAKQEVIDMFASNYQYISFNDVKLEDFEEFLKGDVSDFAPYINWECFVHDLKQFLCSNADSDEEIDILEHDKAAFGITDSEVQKIANNFCEAIWRNGIDVNNCDGYNKKVTVRVREIEGLIVEAYKLACQKGAGNDNH